MENINLKYIKYKQKYIICKKNNYIGGSSSSTNQIQQIKHNKMPKIIPQTEQSLETQNFVLPRDEVVQNESEIASDESPNQEVAVAETVIDLRYNNDWDEKENDIQLLNSIGLTSYWCHNIFFDKSIFLEFIKKLIPIDDEFESEFLGYGDKLPIKQNLDLIFDNFRNIQDEKQNYNFLFIISDHDIVESDDFEYISLNTASSNIENISKLNQERINILNIISNRVILFFPRGFYYQSTYTAYNRLFDIFISNKFWSFLLSQFIDKYIIIGKKILLLQEVSIYFKYCCDHLYRDIIIIENENSLTSNYLSLQTLSKTSSMIDMNIVKGMYSNRNSLLISFGNVIIITKPTEYSQITPQISDMNNLARNLISNLYELQKKTDDQGVEYEIFEPKKIIELINIKEFIILFYKYFQIIKINDNLIIINCKFLTNYYKKYIQFIILFYILRYFSLINMDVLLGGDFNDNIFEKPNTANFMEIMKYAYRLNSDTILSLTNNKKIDHLLFFNSRQDSLDNFDKLELLCPIYFLHNFRIFKLSLQDHMFETIQLNLITYYIPKETLISSIYTVYENFLNLVKNLGEENQGEQLYKNQEIKKYIIDNKMIYLIPTSTHFDDTSSGKLRLTIIGHLNKKIQEILPDFTYSDAIKNFIKISSTSHSSYSEAQSTRWRRSRLTQTE